MMSSPHDVAPPEERQEQEGEQPAAELSLPPHDSPGETPPESEPPAGEPPGEKPPAGDPAPESPPAGDPAPSEPPMTDPPPADAPMRAEAGSGQETAGEQYLEEWSVPLETAPAPEGLAEGATLDAPSGQSYRILEAPTSEGGVLRYAAETADGRRVILREAFGGASALLAREAELLAAVPTPMLPALMDRFERDGRLYLVTEAPEGPTLAEALSRRELMFPQVVRVLAQAAHGLSQMHAAGWAHLGLRPAGIVLGKPVKLTELLYAAPLGEKPGAPFYHAGYSPPELLTGQPADPRADVYALGAVLFHAVNGRPIAETGVELSTWEPPRSVGGVPQILERCLGPRDTRFPTMAQLHQSLLRLARRLTPPVRYSVAAATDIGLEPSRTTNQDAYVWLRGSVATEEGLEEWAVLCVSDGMGGMAAGEVASAAAVKRLAAEAGPAMASFQALKADEQARIVKEWMHAANESAVDTMERLDVRGGATLVCACVVGRRLTIAHVGDCRIYLLRGEEIRQLNRDHSLVMALALQGQIKPEEIRNHPDRSTITRSLGDRRPLPEIFVDGLEQVTGQPTLELLPGDTLLLCSDGLWEPVVEAQMQAAVKEHHPDLAAAADRLVELALEGGGPDNIAVLLFRVEA